MSGVSVILRLNRPYLPRLIDLPLDAVKKLHIMNRRKFMAIAGSSIVIDVVNLKGTEMNKKNIKFNN